jgi:hypothetical protein
MGKLLLGAALAAVLLLPTGPAPADDRPAAANVVTRPGTHDFHDGRVRIAVTEVPGGVRWHVTLSGPGGGGGVGHADPPVPKDAPWFVLVQSPDVVWVFDGRRQVSVIESREIATPQGPCPVVEGTNLTLPDGWAVVMRKNPPREFLDRLPAGLRPKGEPASRPGPSSS